MPKTIKKELKRGLSIEAGNKIAEKIRQAQFKRRHNDHPENQDIRGSIYSEESHAYTAELETPPHIRMSVGVRLEKCRVIYEVGESRSDPSSGEEMSKVWSKKEYSISTDSAVEGELREEPCTFDLSLCNPGEAIVIGAIEEGLANGIIEQTEEEKKVEWRDSFEFAAVDKADKAGNELA